ncbi:hypothetical protein [Spiroplasma endosymbiont of Polydrusus pterygomalis]|uniref:hypothetical protein n=1 Tax=Spiroplasma endosymbiont of Polydrusus pterygomalis TaxID=3139327 RepID=UPI003CCB5FC2
MTKHEFNEKYKKYGINIDRDLDLYVNDTFKFSKVDILTKAIEDYKDFINSIPVELRNFIIN